MGQDEQKFDVGVLQNMNSGVITRNYFDFQFIIGKGGFGKVK